MSNLEPELQALKENLLDLLELVTAQLTKCKEAIIKSDTDLVKEVITVEKRINDLELAIDKDCENILALYNPVATDLRFVLATLRMGSDLERIGDNAKGLAIFLIDDLKKINYKFIEEFNIPLMLDISISMLNDMEKAIKNEDTQLARKIFKKDTILDENNKKAPKTAAKLIEENPKKVKLILKLFSVVRKIERVGDLVKNVGEEVVFHLEAKVLKHNKDLKR